MPWAAKRQALYAAIVLGVIAVIAGGLSFAFLYKAPSCSDGIKNQTEEGIDCGGMCDKLCIAPRISALWSRSVPVAPGVYHAVAMVQNPETGSGADDLPYTFSLYDEDNVLIVERSGTMAIEPGEVIPLFEPNIIVGTRIPVKTFIAFGQASWKKMQRSENPVGIDSVGLDTANLRLSARVTNPSAHAIPRLVLTSLLYGQGDILVAASQTVVTDIPARGSKEASFTWQQPFPSPAVRSVVTSRMK